MMNMSATPANGTDPRVQIAPLCEIIDKQSAISMELIEVMNGINVTLFGKNSDAEPPRPAEKMEGAQGVVMETTDRIRYALEMALRIRSGLVG